jgi:hypothetical protein
MCKYYPNPAVLFSYVNIEWKITERIYLVNEKEYSIGYDVFQGVFSLDNKTFLWLMLEPGTL